MGSQRTTAGYRSTIKRSAFLRRGVPIHAYVGANGSGKSLAMVYDTLPSLLQGRRVLSTVHLLDWRIPDVHQLHAAFEKGDGRRCNPEAHHPLFEELHHYRQLLDAEHCDVLLDEVTGVASSRESQGMPAEIANLLVQLRRRDVALRWSAPSWKRADVIIRETSQAVTVARGFLATASMQEREIVRELSDGTTVTDTVREPNLWRSRRLFRWLTYDAVDFEEFELAKVEDVKPLARQWFRRSGHLAQVAYDSLASVSQLGTISDSGRCMTCHGRRRPEPCRCPAGTIHPATTDVA